MTFAASLLKYLPLRRKSAAAPRTPTAMPAPLMLALEPRIVYDASAAAIGAAASAPHHHADPDAHRAAESSPAGGARAHNELAPRAVHGYMQENGAAGETQVVFIDPSVANYQTLLEGLPAGTQYVVLNPDTDGLAQIVQYLQQHPGVDAIHLVSHGEDGAVQVGSTWLTNADISAYSGELAQIGAAMAPGGDFLIYGCDVAEFADGKALVQQIAAASHLNVAASTDATGSAALGGDWTLEYDVGTVTTPVIFSKAAEQQFDGLLGVTVETYDNSDDSGFVTAGGANGVTSFNLDGITYTTDQPAEFAVENFNTDPGSPPPLTSSASPKDNVLVGNVTGGPMTTLTMSLQNGDLMTVQSFDIDINAPSDVTVEAINASGAIVGTVVLNTANNGGNSSFTVDLSSNSAFVGIKSLEFVETDGQNLLPTLDNFTYIDITPPPVMTTSGGSAAFVSGDNTASTPVVVGSGITLSDASATTATQGTVAITGNFIAGQDVLAFNNVNSATYGDISGSYNAGTGVLTLTSASGNATITQWQNAFDAVTYTDTAVTPITATRTISFTLTSDANANSSNTVTKTVTVADTDQTPIVSTSGVTTTYEAGASATTIDSDITVTDLDNTTQASATVSITSGLHAGDTLGFTNNGSTMGNITVSSYNSVTGVLTLTSAGDTATTAQWGNALSAVTFSSTSTTYGDRTIAFATSDGVKTSAAATDTVDVTDPAMVTTDGGSAAFVAGDNSASTPVAVDSGLTVSDAVTTTLDSATVSITANFHSGEDVLGFVSNPATMGNITGVYNATTGVLTLTSASGSATITQWQNALDSVTYTDTAITPNNLTRTISFTVTDSNGTTSNTATRTVTVADTDQTPIVTTTGGTTDYVGGASAVTIDSGITVSDLDNTTQASGTVSISSGFHSGDTLGFTNDGTTMGNISASYDAATGVMTLTSSGATATTAQWAAALSSVTFSSTSTTYGDRTIAFATSDGTKTSAAATDTMDVLGPPQITTDGGSAAFVAGDNTASTPVAIDSGLALTDGVSTKFSSATIAITGNFQAGEDVLAFTNNGSSMGNIAGTYNAATGVLTLTSSGASATLAQWQNALDSVTYTDTAVTPKNTTRTISFTATDSSGNTSNTATRTVTVADTDQTPVVTTTGGTTDYVGGASAVTIDGGITVSDLDNTTQASGTVSIASGFHSGDTLAYANTSSALFGNIVGSYNAATGVLTLTSSGGTASDEQWANALSAVTFSSSSAVTSGNRTISFTTNDGEKTSAAATRTVDVLGPPQITTDSGSAAFVAGDNTASTPVTIDSGLALTDGASTTLSSATIAITGNFHSGEDVLAFTNNGSSMGNIAGSYNAATGVLTLTSSGASATLAQWQNALDSVTYTDTAVTPNNATRTISFTATDASSNTSNTATRTVTVADTDQTPIVKTTNVTTDYRSGSTATTIDSGITVSDLDNTTQSTATVSIGSGFQSGDILAFTNNGVSMGNIAASYNASTGVLTLTSSGATATTAQWASALSSVTFSSTSTTYGNRTISFATNDGTKTSAPATDTVDVINPMVLGPDTGSASFVEGDNAAATPVPVGPDLTLTDADASAPPASATIAITGNFHSGEDVLSFTNTNAATFGDLSGTYNAATGVLTLTSASGHATVAQWQSALDAIAYTDTSVPPATATRTISFTVADSNGYASNTVTRTVTVATTDQSPVVTAAADTTTYAVGRPATTIDTGITVSDLDNTTQMSATVSIGAGFQSGDTLAFANTGSTAFGNIAASYNASTGVLTLTSTGATATNAQWASALSSVTFSSTSAVNGSRAIAFAVSDGTKTSAPASASVLVDTQPARNTSNAAPGAVPVAPPPESVSSASPDTPFNPSGSAESNTPSVLAEMDHPHPVGTMPSIPTMTFTGTGTPSSYTPGRTSVQSPAPLVPPELSAPGDSLAAQVPAAAPPVMVPVDARGAAGAFTVDISSVDGGAFADATDVSVSLADGKTLPAWLHYDASKGTLTGTMPGGAHDVHVLVQVRDASGHVIRREIVLAPNDHGAAGTSHMASPHAALEPSHGLVREASQRTRLLAGKPSLAHQFAAARAALHVARPAPEFAATPTAGAREETGSHA
jgi:trimeric autotransporter adhesin